MKKSIETKQLLLDTVKQLLTYTADIKVKDITESAFVNIAAVNYHFDDKDRLVELAMNEIFADFKYCLNNFETSAFNDTDEAIFEFITIIFQFVSSHIGFFRRIAQTGTEGEKYFHEEEFIRISTTQMRALGVEKSTEELTALFASALAQIIFAVLCFPREMNQGGKNIFFKTYINQIKTTFR